MSAVVLTAVLATGCGSGGGATAAPALKKRDFIQRANEICFRAGEEQLRRFEALEKRGGFEGKSGPALFTAQMKLVVLPSIRSQIAEIRRLSPPSGDDGKINAILSAEETAVDHLASMSLIRSHVISERYFLKPSTLAREYGYVVCGHSRWLENRLEEKRG